MVKAELFAYTSVLIYCMRLLSAVQSAAPRAHAQCMHACMQMPDGVYVHRNGVYIHLRRV